MEEQWRNIKGFEGLYRVSSHGRVEALSRTVKAPKGRTLIREGGIKMPGKTQNGYLQLALFKDGQPKRMLVHRLVAEAFISNPENKSQVNHKNGIKTDNRAENLEWVTSQENLLHSFRHLGRKNVGKPVIQMTLEGEFVAEYCSVSEAIRQTGVDRTVINFCLKPSKKRIHLTAGGFRWKFKGEPTKPLIYKERDYRTLIASRQRPVYKVEAVGNKVLYESISTASKELGINKTSISAVLAGKQKTAGGFRWEYKSN